MTIMSESETPKESKPTEEETKPTEEETPTDQGSAEGTEGEEKNDIFSKITKNDVTAVTNDLKLGLAKVDMQDEHGMTPLMHAAYRGNKEMCEILLDHGADVNGGSHNNGYTALHFAGLSGNAGLCQLLLQNGASPSVKNSVSRTAAQMAAFVGNHNCVSSINSFVDRKDVEFHTIPRGFEGTAKLDPLCVSSLHNLISQVNFHPVRVALTVKKNTILVSHLESIYKVLKLMSEREMKKGIDTNEIASFKMHCLSETMMFINHEIENAPKSKDPFESFIQKLIKCDTPGGIPEGLERELRECVRTFPFHQSAIMQQLVANLAHLKLGDEPGAWGVIRSVVNGQKGFQDNEPCAACGEEHGVKKCSRCHFDAYCDQDCQKVHWFVHKKYCKQKAERYAKAMNKAKTEKASQPD